MFRLTRLALIAGALAACAPPRAATHIHYNLVETVISPRHLVRLSGLIGLSPAEVQQRLAGLAAAWPTPMALEVASPDGVHAFVGMYALLQDQNAAEIDLRSMSSSQGPPIGFSHCSAGYADQGDNSPVDAILATFEFREGRLIGAWREAPAGSARTATVTLESGPDFTSRWSRRPLVPATVFAVTCKRQDVVAKMVRPAPPPEDLAGDLQGLALLPAAGRLPGLNARRAAAMREGALAIDALRPGVHLAGGAGAFAGDHRFVTIHPSADPSYALLEVDLGAYPSRNLTYFHRTGLAGVRNDRVVWRMRSSSRFSGLAREPELPPRP